MGDLFTAIGTYGTNPLAEAARPIVELIGMATGPILAFVVAIEMIYLIYLGVRLARAEETRDRQKAKGRLKDSIIGFLLIFVLIVVLRIATGPLLQWVNNSGGTGSQISVVLDKTGR